MSRAVGWCLFAFGCLLAGSFELAVLHDVLVWRSETDASTACFKAMFSCAANHTRRYNRVELVQTSEERYQPSAIYLGGGLFDVTLWYDCTQGPRKGARFPVRCTMHCGGMDDWELVDVTIDDEPRVVCHEQYSPTGILNELWIYSWIEQHFQQ